jgi:hypothetical protein
MGRKKDNTKRRVGTRLLTCIRFGYLFSIFINNSVRKEKKRRNRNQKENKKQKKRKE